jgi:CHAT domain-containing protein/Flp pilus assembly protein TadD
MRHKSLILSILVYACVVGGLSQTPLPTPTDVDPRVETIVRLNGEAQILFSKGTPESLRSAIDKFLEAARLVKEFGDKTYEARCLVSAATAYSKLGDSANALKYIELASIEMPAGESRLGADILQNLGLIYNNIGEHGRAYAAFFEEFNIRARLNDEPGQIGALHNCAMILNELGDLQRAKFIYEKILDAERKSEDKRALASSINNLAYVYWKLEDYIKAAELYQEAYDLAVDENMIDIQAATQIGLGDSYKKRSLHQQAKEYYNRGLSLSRQCHERTFEADALYGLGNVYQNTGDKQRAREFYDQALTLQEAMQAREQLTLTLAAEMSVWLELGQPKLAILYGKRAVNLNQAIRGGLGNFDKGVQRLYVRSKESAYRDLSNLLISEGRLPEAQGVLDLLKEQEYEQFSHLRSGESADTVPYSRAEGDLVTKIESLAVLTRRETDLEQAREENGKLSEAQKGELKTLLEDIEAANRAFRLSLDALGKAETSVTAKISEIEADKNLQVALSDLRKELKTGVAAIYTVIGTEEVKAEGAAKPMLRSKFGWAILITPEGRKAYPIDVSHLEENVQTFRTALRTPDYDPRPVAQKLYNAIFRQTSAKQKTTLERDLTEIFSKYKDKTIMWSLDGVLRYVPMSALYDGKDYLVEKYRNSVFTKQSLLLLTKKDAAKWETLGLGISEQKTIDNLSFSALDGTRRELQDIVREPDEKTGILDGTRKLNNDFTKDATIELLRERRYQAVHIASHFSFNPTDQAESFLVIGDGKLTFADIQDKDNLLGSVDLLTLSACDTAMASNGKESEGFPFLAQSLGAKSVIASLWKVSDKGTPELMIRFYKLRAENPGMPKGEAFRQAQLSLLNGSFDNDSSTANGHRSDPVRIDGSAPALSPFAKDPSKPFAHPHYWASFVLIGNWR